MELGKPSSTYLRSLHHSPNVHFRVPGTYACIAAVHDNGIMHRIQDLLIEFVSYLNALVDVSCEALTSPIHMR